MIGLSGINYPAHDLTVRVKEINRPPEEPLAASATAGTSRHDSHSNIVELLSDDDNTGDEYEDASDIVMEDVFTRPQPLSKSRFRTHLA